MKPEAERRTSSFGMGPISTKVFFTLPSRSMHLAQSPLHSLSGL